MAVTDQTDEMFAGTPRTLRFTVTDEDTTGSPAKDLTDLTPKFTLSKLDTAGDPKATPIVEKTGAVTDAAGGIFTVALAAADTADLKPGDYGWQASLFTSGGDEQVVATGTTTIRRNVTNA